MPNKQNGNAEEEAIRDYLLTLTAPDALVDQQRAEELEKEIAQLPPTDTITRVRLKSELYGVQHPPIDHLQAQFVQNAKRWADANGVHWEVFADEGVPRDVLRDAGFPVPERGRRRATAATSTAKAGSRRQRVTKTMIEAAIPDGETFTTARLMELSGGGNAPTRELLKSLVEAGKVVEVGPDPDYDGPGRTPTLYRKAA